VIVLIAVSPIGYVLYSYHGFNALLNPGTPKASAGYVVVYTPSGQFYTLSSEESRKLLGSGELPSGSKLFNVSVESYLTGSPGVDLNLTLRSLYGHFTVVMGDPSVTNCKSSPVLYAGNCRYRVATVSEVAAMVSSIFTTNYYLKGLQMGYDNATAKQYAFNQTWLRYRKAYLTFWTKLEIGSGRIGHKDQLAIILVGPAENAAENRIFAPRRGVLVIEGKTDEALRAEVVLIENLIGFSWPANSTKG